MYFQNILILSKNLKISLNFLIKKNDFKLIMIFYLTWKKSNESPQSKLKHIRFGLALSIFSWLTMAIIVAILGFMMDSGNWLTDKTLLTGFTNPLYLPQLYFRTPLAMALGGSFVLFLTMIYVKKDNIIRVEDNGRGIPTEEHPVEKLSSLEIVLTQLHAGGKFDNDTYKVSGGLHGVGVSVVNALSEWLEVTVYREPSIFFQRYLKGIPVAPVAVIGETENTGTVVRFKADDTILDAKEYSYRVLTERFRELAFLNKGIRIAIRDERAEEVREHEFHFEGGIKSFITHLNESNTQLTGPLADGAA